MQRGEPIKQIDGKLFFSLYLSIGNLAQIGQVFHREDRETCPIRFSLPTFTANIATYAMHGACGTSFSSTSMDWF